MGKQAELKDIHRVSIHNLTTAQFCLSKPNRAKALLTMYSLYLMENLVCDLGFEKE